MHDTVLSVSPRLKSTYDDLALVWAQRHGVA